jgi:hypothetical protein
MTNLSTQKFGNCPEGFEPSALYLGFRRHSPAAYIRVLGSTYFNYSPIKGRSQGGTL